MIVLVPGPNFPPTGPRQEAGEAWRRRDHDRPRRYGRRAMGENGLKRTDEDELCAIQLRNRLERRPSDPDAIRRLILAGGEVGRFHDPSRPYLHPEDVDCDVDIDRYDFAIRVEFEEGRPVARMETSAMVSPNSVI